MMISNNYTHIYIYNMYNKLLHTSTVTLQYEIQSWEVNNKSNSCRRKQFCFISSAEDLE